MKIRNANAACVLTSGKDDGSKPKQEAAECKQS